MNNNKIFNLLLGNSLIASITNSFVWFAVTFWVYLETQSVLATSFVAGIFSILNAVSAVFLGGIVDHNKKKSVMLYSGLFSFTFYILASFIFFSADPALFKDYKSVMLWVFVILAMIGSVAGNIRNIAITTVVSILFKEDEARAKANGKVGTMYGISFAVTSVISGLAIGYMGMGYSLMFAIIFSILSIVSLFFINFKEDLIMNKDNTKIENENKDKKLDLPGTVRLIKGTPGLSGLILFNVFNNFLGGVFMALMDAYGLSLLSVQLWGMLLGFISVAFIVGGLLTAKYGLGKNPVRTILTLNVVMWITCIFFTIQASVILLIIGMFIWMALSPIIEAAEATVLQKVVPLERQGRVIGFAQSLESGASPFTTFLIGPLAQFVFIPFMTGGAGVYLIGEWFGTGANRGMALVFISAGFVGLVVTVLSFYTKSYRLLSETYSK